MTTSSKAKQGAGLKQRSITTTNEIGLLRRMPDMKGTCPLLLADLSDEMGMPAFGAETSVNAQVVYAREQALYLFRFQVGATLVCWLADPNDHEVCSMLQAWASAGYMFAALKTRNGVMVRTQLVGGIPPTTKDIHASSGAMDIARFIRSIVEVGNAAFIKAQVQSDIASVQKIWKVRVFYILGTAARTAVSERLTQI